MTKRRLLSSFLAVMLALTAMAITVPAMAGRVDDFPTFTGYSAKSVYTHDLNDGSLKISWKTNYATSFHVKAILLNEQPIEDDYQGQRALATPVDKDQTSSSLSLSVTKLLSAAKGQDAMYVKIAVGAQYEGHTYWTWIGFRLLPPDDFPDFDSPYSTAKHVYDYDLSNGTLTLSWDTWSDSFRVKAILLNEVPKSDDNQANKAVKVLADKTQSSYKISFTKSQLTSANAQYLKIAVGSELLGHTYWNWVGFKLNGTPTPVPVSETAPFGLSSGTIVKTYTSGTARTYSDPNLQSALSTVSSSTEIQILSRVGNAFKISYGSQSQAYISVYDVTDFSGNNEITTSSGQFNCALYRDGTLNSAYYVAKGDRVQLIAESGDWVQILYPTSGSYYRLAWAKKQFYNRYCLGISTGYPILGGYIDYWPGDYWTTDGTACPNHSGGCKSLTYGGGSQCYGFAQYVEDTLYGSYANNGAPRLENAYVAPGQLSAEKIKELVWRAGLGAHIRTNEYPAKKVHSFIVTAISDTGFSVIDCNRTANCQINTNTYTWQGYVNSTFGGRGINFITVHTGPSPAPVTPSPVTPSPVTPPPVTPSPVTPAPVGSAQLAATASPMQADGTFTVTLEIIHNPGFTAIEISHDASRMGVTVLRVENTGIAAKATLDDGTNINQLIRIVNFSGDLTGDGPILQLTVKPNTKGDKILTFTCVNCGNWDSQQIIVHSDSVDLVEVSRVKGDIDGNNDVDIFDVIRLLRYLNDKAATVVIENCNVDGAGTIDIFDVIRLLRYLNDKSTVIY